MAEEKGLRQVKAIYQDRGRRVRGLRAEGKKVIGYLCAYPVLEMLTALELVPFRILGDTKEPVSRADSCLPTVVCPFIRSALDLGLKNRYDFLDGVVIAHTCDIVEKTAHIWNSYLKPPYFHFIDTPHTVHSAAITQHKNLLKEFQKTLEQMAGRGLSRAELKKAIKLHNQQRALVRGLYGLRKADPPPISGAETLEVMVALMSLPVAEGNDLLRQVITEVKERPDRPAGKAVRLLVWGSIIDSSDLLEMIEGIEGSGASVVMDDTCVGSRFYWPDVELTEDPLDGLAYRYLVGLKCPRTMRQLSPEEAGKDYQADLENRFGHLKDYAREWKADGVILQSLRYCDSHGYEVPQVKDYLNGIGLPSTYIEYGYSQAAMAPLRTRVQAFLEIISRGR